MRTLQKQGPEPRVQSPGLTVQGPGPRVDSPDIFGSPRNKAMIIKTGLNPKSGFTRIPNTALDDHNLTAHELLLWIRLLSLASGGEFVAKNATHAAELCNVGVDVFRDRRRSLVKKGYLASTNKEICLIVPNQGIEIKSSPMLEVAQEEKQSNIAEEISVQPNRKPSGISQADASIAVVKAWNSNKPDGYMECPSKLHPSTFIAIETQAKRLGIERSEYADLVKRVLKGCTQDDWWKERVGIKVNNIFGFGAHPEDKKFQNVEKLYKIGSKVADKFSWSNDESIFAWYSDACPNRVFNKIVHLDVPDAPTSWQHDVEHRDGDTIFIYHSLEDDGFVVNWTLGKKVQALKTPPNRR